MVEGSCPAGQEKYGLDCVGACPAGFTRTAICTCAKGWEIKTDCAAFGAKGYIPKTCPSDTDTYAGTCYYDKCPSGSSRTAVSTCSHSIRWNGNTHLYISNRAIDLLAASTDEHAKSIANMLNQASCREQWENGLWDTDHNPMSEVEKPGTHFYNGAGKDWDGKGTGIVTYDIAGLEQKKYGNARTNAESARMLIEPKRYEPDCYKVGIALHYVTDVTQPMHASGFDFFKVPTALHSVFELYVAGLQSRSTIDGMSFASIPYAKDKSADQIFDEISRNSNALAPALMKALKGRNDGTYCSMTPVAGITYTGNCFVNDPAVNAEIDKELKSAFGGVAAYLYAAFEKRPEADASDQGVVVADREAATTSSSSTGSTSLYMFVNKLQGLCLDPGGYSGSSGTDVGLYRCDGGLDQAFKYPGTGQAKLVNAKGDVCLDVAGYDGTSGLNVGLYTCDGGKDQEWSLSEAQGGWTRIVNARAGTCLAVDGSGAADSNIRVETCTGNDNQLWAPALLPGPRVSGALFINRAKGFCLDPAGYDGASTRNVGLYRCDGGLDQAFSAPSQTARALSNLKQSGIVLDVAGYDGAAGRNVGLYTLDGNADQLWTVETVKPNGWSRLKNGKGTCLMAEGNAGLEANVAVGTCGDSAEGLWSTVLIPAP